MRVQGKGRGYLLVGDINVDLYCPHNDSYEEIKTFITTHEIEDFTNHLCLWRVY